MMVVNRHVSDDAFVLVILIAGLMAAVDVNGDCVCNVDHVGIGCSARNPKLTKVPLCVSDATTITYLDLKRNAFTTLPQGIFDKLIKLQFLDLQFNSLTALPRGIFDKLTNLTSLSLSDNRLTRIPPGIFDKLTKLQALSLYRSRIQVLPSGVFDNLTKLRVLYLNINDLTTLPPGIFDKLANLGYLRMDENPWNCSSSICQWLPGLATRKPLTFHPGSCEQTCCSFRTRSDCSSAPACIKTNNTSLTSIQCRASPRARISRFSAQPTGIRATTVRLTWTAAYVNVISQTITCSVSSRIGNAKSQTFTLSADTRSYDVPNLSPETNYTCVLTAATSTVGVAATASVNSSSIVSYEYFEAFTAYGSQAEALYKGSLTCCALNSKLKITFPPTLKVTTVKETTRNTTTFGTCLDATYTFGNIQSWNDVKVWCTADPVDSSSTSAEIMTPVITGLTYYCSRNSFPTTDNPFPYYLTPMTFEKAEEACSERGAGWTLVEPESSVDMECIRASLGANGGTPTWLKHSSYCSAFPEYCKDLTIGENSQVSFSYSDGRFAVSANSEQKYNFICQRKACSNYAIAPNPENRPVEDCSDICMKQFGRGYELAGISSRQEAVCIYEKSGNGNQAAWTRIIANHSMLYDPAFGRQVQYYGTANFADLPESSSRIVQGKVQTSGNIPEHGTAPVYVQRDYYIASTSNKPGWGDTIACACSNTFIGKTVG